jgi:hypothetical protein
MVTFYDNEIKALGWADGPCLSMIFTTIMHSIDPHTNMHGEFTDMARG